MKKAMRILSGVLVAAAMTASAQDQKPVRLMAEAEDFAPKGAGWEVVPYRENYFASTFAITFLSRMACLAAPEQVPDGQAAVAEQEVEIPYADEYQVLARYEQPFNFAVEFTVEIDQGGKTVSRQVFGRLQDPKIWPLNGHQRVAMERFWWGGTDNIVWQHPGAARLAAGKAVIRLIAGPQVDGRKPRLNAAKRSVDIVCLTNDRRGMEAQKQTRYLEFDGWLVQDGDLFARFTNPRDAAGPCIPTVGICDQHSPYYIHARDWGTVKVLKSGRLLEGGTNYVYAGPRSGAVRTASLAPVIDPAKLLVPRDTNKPAAGMALVIPPSEYLKSGESSGWVPIGQNMDALHNCMWGPGALYTGRVAETYLAIEFAIPDGRGGLKTIRTATVRSTRATNYTGIFEIPGNIAPNPAVAAALQARWWPPRIRTQQEALAWLRDEVRRFPDKGPTPQRFLVYNIGGFGGTPSFPEGRELMVALGDNTMTGQEGKKRDLVCHWPDTSMAAVQKRNVTNVYAISYGDETHLPSVTVSNDVFAAWLKSKGVAYDGSVQWTSDRSSPLYYYSQICGVEQGAKPYVAATAYYRSKGALTGANYSPHSNYLVTEMHYMRPFKLNALSMAWAEDYVWQVPEFSVQAIGYLTSAFRAGTKYNRQPIMMYVMPHSPGNTPRDFRLSFYTTVAHGTRLMNYFCASPLAVGGTENYVATDDLAMWREIHACTHEAGVFEDYVMDGATRPAKVGLLLSSVDDIMTGANNAVLALHNNERKAIYYALRHAQVPVDMLSEDDVVDGLARDYSVIYVTQQWLHSACVGALKRWVEKGGTLVALCGGGFRDEFNRDSAAAAELYGARSQKIGADPQLVSRYLLKENVPFLTKQDLPLYEPIDAVSWGDGDRVATNVGVVVWKQALDPVDAQVIGRFRDGKPAVVSKPHGKGKAVLFGFLPGQAYLKSGLPVRPADRGSTDAAFAHFLPTAMDAGLRQRLVDDFLPAGYARPVVCSEALVESACIDSPKQKKLAVALMNYTGKAIERLSVRIDGVKAGAKVRSVERGPLKPEFRADGSAVVELPLNVADMLLIDL